MRKVTLLAAAGIAALSSPALAQEGTSVFVGPIVGYDNVKLGDSTYSEHDDGVMYGVVAGIDYIVNEGMFIGLEGEFSDSGTGETITDLDVPGDSASIEAGRNLYVGARVGVPIGSSNKAYVKGGYSNARVKGIYDDTVDTYSISDDLDGWVVGVGTDLKISPVVLRLEYRYSDYNTIKVLGFDTGVDATRHQVVAGALLSF